MLIVLFILNIVKHRFHVWWRHLNGNGGETKGLGTGRPTRRYIIVGERRQRQSQHYKGFDETAQVVQLVQGPRRHHTYLVSCIICYGLEVDTMSVMQRILAARAPKIYSKMYI